MKQLRNNPVPVRFTDLGLLTINHERGQISRSEYIRQAVAFAINHGFKPKKEKM